MNKPASHRQDRRIAMLLAAALPGLLAGCFYPYPPPPVEPPVVERPVEPEPVLPPAPDYPVATRTNSPGQVLSPYAPYNVIDVTGYRSGQLVRDPSNQRIFRIP
jgi:hypothetical protein